MRVHEGAPCSKADDYGWPPNRLLKVEAQLSFHPPQKFLAMNEGSPIFCSYSPFGQV